MAEEGDRLACWLASSYLVCLVSKEVHCLKLLQELQAVCLVPALQYKHRVFRGLPIMPAGDCSQRALYASVSLVG